MDGIRAIAIAYYDRATKGEKDLVKQYFKKFDTNGDGKITLQQFKNGVAKHLSDENIFRKLDANGDGKLDFDHDIVCLYYMEKKLELHKCGACRGLLIGAYFSCLRCVEDGLMDSDQSHLCCACYHLGEFGHVHGLINFLDQHTMTKVLKNRTPDALRDKEKNELEELKQIAKSYYLAGSQELQDSAHKFFDAMDMDGDGKVDLSEFMEFMKEEGCVRMQNPTFFRELDMDGNGTLDFDEVMTAYYISKSGRPFCDECGNFIRGVFFSCVECYRDPKTSFNLCRDCYRSKKCDHKHDGRRAQFLDNFALLEATKDSGPAQAKSDQQNQAKSPVPSNSGAKSPIVPSNTQAKSPPVISSHSATTVPPPVITNLIYNTYVVNPPPPVTNYYNNAALVRPPHRNRWGIALKAFEATIAIGGIVSMCTIM